MSKNKRQNVYKMMCLNELVRHTIIKLINMKN